MKPIQVKLKGVTLEKNLSKPQVLSSKEKPAEELKTPLTLKDFCLLWMDKYEGFRDAYIDLVVDIQLSQEIGLKSNYLEDFEKDLKVKHPNNAYTASLHLSRFILRGKVKNWLTKETCAKILPLLEKITEDARKNL